MHTYVLDDYNKNCTFRTAAPPAQTQIASDELTLKKKVKKKKFQKFFSLVPVSLNTS